MRGNWRATKETKVRGDKSADSLAESSWIHLSREPGVSPTRSRCFDNTVSCSSGRPRRLSPFPLSRSPTFPPSRDRCYAHLHASLNIPRAKHCATSAAQLEQNGRCIDIYGSLPCAPKVYGRDFFPYPQKNGTICGARLPRDPFASPIRWLNLSLSWQLAFSLFSRDGVDDMCLVRSLVREMRILNR